MRKIVFIAGLASILLAGIPNASAATPKATPGSVVIVFKDGHRQTFNLADIDRIEFPAGDLASSGTLAPSRARFIGKWEVGDGMGSSFVITLSENGDAMRTLGDVHGKWNYVDGEAQIRWDDGAEDAIRRVGARYQKFAYKAGKAFTDVPDNVTSARNTTPKPI
jgi:hypothetical protein